MIPVTAQECYYSRPGFPWLYSPDPMSQTLALKQQSSWQELLAGALTDVPTLCRLLGIDSQALPAGHPLLANFPLRVPAPYLARIEPGNPQDPLLLQVFPAAAEALPAPGFSDQPLEEERANPAPGILHKYHGRALLLVTAGCAINCRYCFRRHFPYQDNLPGRQAWQDSLDYIKEDTGITEVIFSGGDPLTLPDRTLAWFLDALAAIDHVQRIRVHTRLPIMIPQRVTDELCRILANPRFRTILVLHSNHAREFDADVDAACARLKTAGLTLLNQSVLLRGVNDSVVALQALSERLFAAGILPYYLHLLDRVTGAAHFDVLEAQAQDLMAGLRGVLPGYLVPKLVREIPGAAAKMPAGDPAAP